ncbi:susceptibility to T cell mediated cytotoxicity [Pristimantis euphronides]
MSIHFHLHHQLTAFISLISLSVVYSKMSRRLAAFTLILGSLQGFLCQVIQVFQVPEVHATPGSDATLPCTYNVSGVVEGSIGSYKWYRHLVKTGTEVSNIKKEFAGRISRADLDQFIKSRWAHIIIHNVDPTDTGTYYCEVTFLHGGEKSVHGAGTLLNVTDLLEPLFQYKSLYISLGTLSGVVLVILLVVGCYLLSKQVSFSLVRGPNVSTEFTTLDNRQSGPCGPEMLQYVETSHCMMENQQYSLFQPFQDLKKPGSAIYQEGDLYSIIP